MVKNHGKILIPLTLLTTSTPITPGTPSNPMNPKGIENPSTGDVGLTTSIASILAAACLLIATKKKKRWIICKYFIKQSRHMKDGLLLMGNPFFYFVLLEYY